MWTEKQAQEIINRRHDIVVSYCNEKGWDPHPGTLSLEQIMEIRSQQNWKEVPTKILEETK